MTTLAEVVQPERVVETLRRDYSLSQDLLAKSTGASVRTVRNWEKTGAIKPRYEARLNDLRDIVLILESGLTPKGVGQWLRARHHALDGRTAWEALAAGDHEAVRDAALAYATGTYL